MGYQSLDIHSFLNVPDAACGIDAAGYNEIQVVAAPVERGLWSVEFSFVLD